MKIFVRLLLVLVITCCAYWAHSSFYHWACERIGGSYPLSELWGVMLSYGFLYLLAFTVAAVFENPTPRQMAYGSLVVLVASFAPLFAVDLREYLYSHIPIQEFMYHEQRAYPALLVTHGATLLGVNLLFWFSRRFTMPSRPVPA